MPGPVAVDHHTFVDDVAVGVGQHEVRNPVLDRGVPDDLTVLFLGFAFGPEASALGELPHETCGL